MTNDWGRMQPPRDGCSICGTPVRTRKGGAWVCAKCFRKEGK